MKAKFIKDKEPKDLSDPRFAFLLDWSRDILEVFRHCVSQHREIKFAYLVPFNQFILYASYFYKVYSGKLNTFPCPWIDTEHVIFYGVPIVPHPVADYLAKSSSSAMSKSSNGNTLIRCDGV